MKTHRLSALCLRLATLPACLIACFISSVALASATSETFPVPEDIAVDVQFWVRVYSELGSRQGVLHDARALDVVYETVEGLPEQFTQARNVRVEHLIRSYRSRLLRLATGSAPRDALDERLTKIWQDSAALLAAADRVRFQSGQKERFRAGIERAGAWRPHIERMLAEAGLPIELATLPHVESSYDPTAYSKVGAAGLWQLMRATARPHMRVDRHIDERFDPLIATRGAIAYLRQAYRTLGDWPLVVTSYNHGVGGMQQAKRLMKTSDIVRILRHYDGRSFKFASRNFYPSFLAALQVERNAEQLFGPIRPQAPWQTCRARLRTRMSIRSLAATTANSLEELRTLNPALRPAVWRGVVPVPTGYALRFPADTLRASLNAKSQSLFMPRWTATYVPRNITHTVRRGETLSHISRKFGIPVRAIQRANHLRRTTKIRVGARLIVGTTSAPSLAAGSRSTEETRAYDCEVPPTQPL